MKNLRAFPLWALAGALSCSVATAQLAAPAARIVSRIDESNLVTLRGNVNPHANAKNDRGPVSAGFVLPDLTLVLSRSAEQQAAFDAFVASQYDQSSPNFHNWLTPQQIGEEFGPAQADIDAITGWLTSHGFTVNRVSPDRLTIHFAGTAGQVESAFHTAIHRLDVNGVAHYANMTDPQIPAALAPVVVGVKALHNFLPHPLHRLGSSVRFDTQTGRWQRITNTALSSELVHSPSLPASLGAGAHLSSGAHPMFGVNGEAGTQNAYLEEDVSPYDFATIYNLPSGWPNSNNGSGQTIAIAGTSLINVGKNGGANDVATFRSAFGLPAGSTPNEIDAGSYFKTGTTASICTSTSSSAACGISDLEENSLDVEWSGAVAPGAQIDLVVTGQSSSCNTSTGSGCIDTVYDSAAYVVDNVTAKILSVSYGECELYEGTAGNVAYYDLWQQAAAEGISVFVATGDSGSPACDDGLDSQYGNPYVAQYGLSVNGLASTPFNTAVGGTDFSWCQPYYTVSGTNINFAGCATSSTTQGSPAYWNTSNNSTTGASAAGYVPEIPWNDTCENPIQARYVETLLSTTGADSYFGINPTTPEEICTTIYEGWSAINGFFENAYGVQVDLSGFVDTVGGGGGASGCVASTSTSTTSTCTAGATSTGATTNPDTGAAQASLPLVNDGWPKPWWQIGIPGVPSDGVRDIPDVSLFSGDGSLYSATLICVSNLGSCTYPASTSSQSQDNALIAQEVGGTSVATPEMAGVMALINQKTGSAQGLAAPGLYKLAAAQNYSNCSAEKVTNSSSCYFQDIDNGLTAASGPAFSGAETNTMPCDLNNGEEGGDGAGPFNGTTSPNCVAINSGDVVGTLVSSGTTPGYNSAVGYDLATGLGSLNVANVVNNWPSISVTGTNTATVNVMAASTLNSNTTLSVTATVSGSAGTPTGTLSITAGSYTNSQTLGSGGCAATGCVFTVPANSFTASGTAYISVGYSGDSHYAAATGTAQVAVTVSSSSATYSLATPSNPAAVNPGGTVTVTISGQTSSSGYSGTVSFSSCTMTSSTVTNPNDPPTCTVSGTITYTAGAPSGTATATVTTTAGVAKLAYPKVGNGRGWMGAGSGAVLAFLVLLGIPARRRSWRAMLGMVVLLTVLGGLAACGGGGGGGGGSGNVSGTSAGQYTFTVTGVGNDASKTTATTTFTLTVN